MSTTPLVALHVWRVRRVGVPVALWRMARDRRRLRATAGVRFAKLLGTGRDGRFGPAQADPGRWAALVVWADPAAATAFETGPVARSWAAIASGYCRALLRPVRSRGRWAGQEPFGPEPGHGPTEPAHGPTEPEPGRGATRPVLALTRARLRPSRAVRFWRTIPAVAAPLAGTPGLITAFGIGEAPMGWQGTVSVWRSPAALAAFAYGQPAHRAAIAATPVHRWYAEELFARFDVLDVAGDRSVIGWTEEGDGRP